MTSNGDNCPSGHVVQTVDECKNAATQFAILFDEVRDGYEYPAGCYFSSSIFYFNNIINPSETSPYKHYGAICNKGMIISKIFSEDDLL